MNKTFDKNLRKIGKSYLEEVRTQSLNVKEDATKRRARLFGR